MGFAIVLLMMLLTLSPIIVADAGLRRRLAAAIAPSLTCCIPLGSRTLVGPTLSLSDVFSKRTSTCRSERPAFESLL